MTPSQSGNPETTPRACLDAEQLKVFKSITADYFAKLAPDDSPPVIEEAFLQFDSPMLLDYTSVVTISGDYSGVIYLTATTSIIEQVLHLLHEPEVSEKTRMDMCRELSNVLSGNASMAFGANWIISVPRSITKDNLDTVAFPPATFIMPVQWRQQRSYLVIGLTEQQEAS
jgi:chemotaxis protein CheX